MKLGPQIFTFLGRANVGNLYPRAVKEKVKNTWELKVSFNKFWNRRNFSKNSEESVLV